jgi:hypothetical protein
MPFMQALATTTEGLAFRIAFPRWLISLTKRGREVMCGFEELEVGHLSTPY